MIAEPPLGASQASVTPDDVAAVMRRFVGAAATATRGLARVRSGGLRRDKRERQQGWDRGPGNATDGHLLLPSGRTPGSTRRFAVGGYGRGDPRFGVRARSGPTGGSWRVATRAEPAPPNPYAGGHGPVRRARPAADRQRRVRRQGGEGAAAAGLRGARGRRRRDRLRLRPQRPVLPRGRHAGGRGRAGRRRLEAGGEAPERELDPGRAGRASTGSRCRSPTTASTPRSRPGRCARSPTSAPR